MKKYISILLILLLIFNTCGFIFIYYQVKNVLHSLAENAINNHRKENIEVITAKVNSNMAEMSKEGEFSINGKMYDVIKTVKDKDILFIYCIADYKEEILNKAFDKQVDEQSTAAEGLKKLAKLLIIDGLPIQNPFRIKYSTAQIHLITSNLFYKSISKKVLPPPPNIELIIT